MRRYIKSNKTKHSRNKKVDWTKDTDIQRRVEGLIDQLNLNWLDKSRIICFRSFNSNTRAIARIWGLSRIWQLALETQAAYILEVISEKYDKLSQSDKDKVLLHEMNHIPANFSGSLVPHTRKGKSNFYSRLKLLINSYQQKR